MVASATVQNGDESGTRWIPTFGGAQINHDFLRVPLMHSPAKTMWLRRFGTGDYSFFFVEGFDPQNGTWTGDETAPGNNSSLTPAPSILRIMRNSAIGEGSARFPHPSHDTRERVARPLSGGPDALHRRDDGGFSQRSPADQPPKLVGSPDRLASPPDVEGQGKDQTSVANLRATSIAGEVPAQSRREGETTCEKRRRHAFGG